MNRKLIKEILHNEHIKYSPNSLRIFMNKHNDIKLYCEYVYNKNEELWETPLNVLKCVYKFDKFYFKRCKNCNKCISFSKSISKQNHIACSYKCAAKIKANDKSVIQKRKEACLRKYGVDSYSKTEEFIQNINKNESIRKKISDSVKKSFEHRNLIDEHNKRKETCLHKYGYEQILQVPEIRNKIYKTFLTKIGVKSNVELDKVREKIKQDKFNKSYQLFIKEIEPYVIFNDTQEDFNNKRLLSFTCKKCNKVFKQYWYTTGHIFADSNYDKIPRCPYCYPKYHSVAEQELINFCKQFFNNLIEYDRTLIKPYELDIVIPDLNLAIEFNGIYYHSIEARNITWLSFNEN